MSERPVPASEREAEVNTPHGGGPEEVGAVLKDVERRVLENRSQPNGGGRGLKDFRRIFDQDSSRMNKAILMGASVKEVYRETLQTIAVLVEVLICAKRK